MELFFGFLTALFGVGWFVARGVFKVPDGAIARRGSRIFQPGWHFSLYTPPEVIDLPICIVSIPKHPVRLTDGSEIAITLSIVWKPDPRNIGAYLKYDSKSILSSSSGYSHATTATVDGLLTEWVKDFLNEWGMNTLHPHTLRQALAAKKELQDKIFDKLKNTYRVGATLGIFICTTDGTGRGGVNITDIEPLARPNPEKWGDDGSSVFVVGKRLMQQYQDIEKTCVQLRKEFPDQEEEIEDFRYRERTKLKEKS